MKMLGLKNAFGWGEAILKRASHVELFRGSFFLKKTVIQKYIAYIYIGIHIHIYIYMYTYILIYTVYIYISPVCVLPGSSCRQNFH